MYHKALIIIAVIIEWWKPVVKFLVFQLSGLNCPGILLKGGHSDTDCDDILIAEKETTTFTSKRIGSRNTHGTGCVLSSAIASCLALGLTLREAVKHAKNFVTRAIEEGKNLYFGNGHGPLFLLDKYNSMQ